MIDIHSHILPGVDDGARTLDDSVEIVQELASQGVTDIIVTPHFVDETSYTCHKDDNNKKLVELRERLLAGGIGVNLYLGNEIYINNNIINWLKKGIVSSLNDSDYLLVELPLSGDYPNYEDILEELLQNGYKVILAHPERYETVQEDYQLIRNLYDSGILLQCNIGSINGKYGKAAQKTIKKLAKDNMVFAFGSDIHHCNNSDFLLKAKKKLAKYYKGKDLERVLIKNPKLIL